MTLYLEASPKAISGENQLSPSSIGISRYPHLIPALFNVRGFGPAVSITLPSLTWVITSFRVYDLLLMRLFRLAFATAPLFPLNLATNRNSPVHFYKRHAITH